MLHPLYHTCLRKTLYSAFLLIATISACLPTFAQGGYTLDGNGTNQYVEIPYDAALNPASTFTVEFWAKVEGGAGTWRSPVCSREVVAAGDTRGYLFYVRLDDGTWDFWTGSTGNTFSVVNSGITATSEWTHIAGSYDGTTLRLYVNGVLANSAAGNFTVNSTRPTRIGAGNTEATPDYYFPGKIDEVRIWSDVRTQAEIQANMHKELVGNEANLEAYYQMSDGSGSTLTDNSSNSNAGTITNGPAWKTSGAHAGPGMCLDFDGSDDFVLGSLAAAVSNSISIEGWFSFNSLSSQQNLMRIYQTANSVIRIVPYKTAANLVAFYIYDGSSTYVINSTFTVSQINTWYHLAFVYDAGEVSIYANGKLVGSASSQGSFSTAVSNGISIGADSDGGGAIFYSNTKIDEVRIWGDARTEAEIRANMYRTLEGDEADLLAYYRFDQQNDPSNTTLYDYTSNGNDGTFNDTDATLSWVSSNPFDTWIGSEDSDWSNGENWSNGSAPTTEDVGIYNWAASNAPASANISGRNLYVDVAATLNHSGNLTLNGNLFNEGSFTTSGTLTFSGSSAQTIEGAGTVSTGTLVLNNTAGLTLEQNLTTNTALTLTNGALAIGANTLTINGSISSSSGTLSGGSTSNIVIGGSGASTGLPAVTLNNLTLNRANGISLGGAVTVEGTLSLSNGNLNLNSQTLTIDESASISGASTSRYIVATSGNLRKNYAAATSFNFPVGDGSNYTPISLNFSSGTFASAYAEVDLTASKHPNNTSSNHYINRYWTVSSSGISSFSCGVSATYATSDIVGTETELYGGKWDGSWTELPAVNDGSNLITGTVSGFSDFTAGELSAFPVEWLAFEALLENQFVRLNWATASELNNDYFAVERSLDTESWETLGKVPSIGQSTSRQDYSFRDERPYQGKAQYRLRQVDLDGSLAYSEIVEIERNPVLRVYPNPVNDILNLELPTQGWKAELYGSSGKLVKKMAPAETRIDFTALPKGTYFLRLIGPQGQSYHHMLQKR